MPNALQTTSFEPLSEDTGLHHLTKVRGPNNMTCDITTVVRAMAVLNELLTINDGAKRLFYINGVDGPYSFDVSQVTQEAVMDVRKKVFTIFRALLTNHPNNASVSREVLQGLGMVDMTLPSAVRDFISDIQQTVSDRKKFSNYRLNDVQLSEVVGEFWRNLQLVDESLTAQSYIGQRINFSKLVSVIISSTIPRRSEPSSNTTSIPSIAPVLFVPQSTGTFSMRSADLEDDPSAMSLGEFDKFETQGGGSTGGFSLVGESLFTGFNIDTVDDDEIPAQSVTFHGGAADASMVLRSLDDER